MSPLYMDSLRLRLPPPHPHLLPVMVPLVCPLLSLHVATHLATPPHDLSALLPFQHPPHLEAVLLGQRVIVMAPKIKQENPHNCKTGVA